MKMYRLQLFQTGPNEYKRIPVIMTKEDIIMGLGQGEDQRRVGITHLKVGDDRFMISTVFLMLDHSFGHGDPLLFETMVFKNGDEILCERCSTWEQAELQHERISMELERSMRPRPFGVFLEAPGAALMALDIDSDEEGEADTFLGV
jgi:hypothetical protein